METLPTEIVIKTSRYLRFKDKLNLAVTCRRLYDLISNTSLYQELNLLKYGGKPHKIVSKFEKHPFDGSQVRTLGIKLPQIPEQLRSQLSTVFPNVSRIIVGKNGGSTARVDLRKAYEVRPPLLRWIHTLQTYDMYGDWSEVLHALKFNIFPHLIQLKLGLYYDNIDRETGFDPFYFASVIQNTPYLTKLTFYDCDINLELLEQVHSSCPYLTSLRLEHVSVVVDTPMPQNISPSNGVSELEVYTTALFDKNCLFLEYILEKYKNLHCLTMDLDRQDYNVDAKLPQYFPSFYDNSDEEQEFNSASDQVISQLRNDFISGVAIYNSSGAKFFSSLPKTIKTLRMDIKSINDVLGVLSKSDMNLTELDFCDVDLSRNILMNPYQLRHIFKLKSLKTLKIPINSSVQDRHKEGFISSTITNLVITCQNGPLYIDWVLENFPCLQDLYIKHSKCNIRQLTVDSSHTQTINSQLQSLMIRKCTIYPRILSYIERTAPDMKVLKLDQVAFAKESKEKVCHIDISNWGLKKFHISFTSGGVSKKITPYCQFTVQTNDHQLIHASLGDTISLMKSNGSSEKLEHSTAINGFYEKVKGLRIGDI